MLSLGGCQLLWETCYCSLNQTFPVNKSYMLVTCSLWPWPYSWEPLPFMWKLACCGGSYLQILDRSGYDKWGWDVGMHSVPVIYNHPQKLVLKRKNSKIRLSASPVTEEGEPCCLCLEELFAVKKKLFICLPRFVKKQFHLQRTNHSSFADPPSSLVLRSSGISARLRVPCLTFCLCCGLVLSCFLSGRLCQQWAQGLLIPIRSFGMKLSLEY